MNAKKSFNTTNPALAYIEVPEDDEADSDTSSATPEDDLAKHDPTQKPAKVAKTTTAPKRKATNTKPATKRKTTKKKETERPMKLDPRYIETKSKRVHVLFQPSVYDVIKEMADDNGVSVNETIHDILKAHTEAYLAEK